MIDLDGRTAMPGFIEGHGHFMGMGEAQLQLDLLGTDSWGRIVVMVDSVADATPAGQWVEGRGWHQEKWASTPERMVRGFQTNARLNEVAPDTPVYLTHASAHAAIANDAALEAAGIGLDTSDPSGGTIVRDAQGRATGIPLETAEGPVQEAIEASRSDRSAAERRARREKQVRLAAEEALANGVTSFQDQGAYPWRTLWDDGAVVGNGTDVSVEAVDPLASVHCTVTRQVPDADTAFTAEETLSRRRALRSYTINNAYAAFAEDTKGSLTPESWPTLPCSPTTSWRSRPTRSARPRSTLRSSGARWCTNDRISLARFWARGRCRGRGSTARLDDGVPPCGSTLNLSASNNGTSGWSRDGLRIFRSSRG